MIGPPAKSLRVAAPRGEGRDQLAIARAGARDPIMTLPPQGRLMKDDGYAELARTRFTIR